MSNPSIIQNNQTIAATRPPVLFLSSIRWVLFGALLLQPFLVVGQSHQPESQTQDKRILDEVLSETERIRSLRFKKDVPFKRISRADIGPLFEKEIDRVYSDEALEGIEGSLSLLGAIPEGLEIDRMLLAMVGEQVAGLYDPVSEEMMVVGDLSLEVGLVQIILEHELTHALTDQHFDLQSLPIEDIHNDDRALAALSVVEGDATLSMLEYGKNLGVSALVSTLIVSLFMDQSSFNSAPTFYQASLIFPYMGGEVFLLDLMRDYRLKDGNLVPNDRFRGIDWKLVDHLYRHPPVSTEQIIHPEKYVEGNDLPKEVDRSFLEPAIASGWEIQWENTLGEFLTRTLLEESVRLTEARRASEGWGGDRYFLLAKEGKEVLVWASIWDTLEEREEFAETCDKMRDRGDFPGNAIVRRLENGPEARVGISRDLEPQEIEMLIEKP